QLIVIAEDDSTIAVGTAGRPDTSLVIDAPRPAISPERTLVLGYNSGMTVMLRELAEYVAPGSLTTVVADEDVRVPHLTDIGDLAVRLQRGDTTSRRLLESLDVASY